MAESGSQDCHGEPWELWQKAVIGIDLAFEDLKSRRLMNNVAQPSPQKSRQIRGHELIAG
jgi:hypothetical protein